MKFRMVRCLLGAVCLLTVSLPMSADVALGAKAYQANDFDTAFSEFTKSANLDDPVAQRLLAHMYYLGQGTVKDEAQGTRLARECAEAGDGWCALMYADANGRGLGTPVNYAQGRVWARKAFGSGEPAVRQRGGFLLEQLYLNDPANQYLVDGKRDQEKYNALAHRTLKQRAEQIEALDALAASAASGFIQARILLSSVLFDQSGAGTAQRICTLLTGINDLPPHYERLLQLSQEVANLGPTRGAPSLVTNPMLAMSLKLQAANQPGRAGIKNPIACNDFKVVKFLGATEIENATWLPLTQPLVAQTYSLTGSWSENWSVSLCGVVSTVSISFAGDGWGGAYWQGEVKRRAAK